MIKKYKVIDRTGVKIDRKRTKKKKRFKDEI